MKKLLTTLLIAILFYSVSFAQEKAPYKYRTGIGFVPQYSISGGFRFEFDKSLSKNSNQWIIVSPQVFWVTGNRFNHSLESLQGFGMDVKHKIYLKPESMKPDGFYVQYGVMFQHFSIKDNHEYLESYTENGIEYFTVTEGEITTGLNKFGGNFHLGYQWLIGDKVYFDIYTGAGVRISHNNRNEGFDTWYNNSWIDYGYSGTLLDGGLRIGCYF